MEIRRRALRLLLPGWLSLAAFAGPASAVECVTPLAWQTKLTGSVLDANGNFVADSIEALAPAQPVDIIVAMNRCPTPADLATLAPLGTVGLVGHFLSFVELRNVTAAHAVALAGQSFVAFVEKVVPFYYSLDVANPAVQIGASPDYSPATIADQFGLEGAGINIAILDSGVDNAVHSAFLPLTRFVAGYDVATDVEGDPDDEFGHGTHVASIALGADAAFPGAAPAAGLIDVRLSATPATLTNASVLSGMQKVLDRRADWNVRVANLSVGGCQDSDGKDSVAQLANRMVHEGIVVTVAAGNASNCGRPSFTSLIASPPSADFVITVANSDDLGTIDRANDVINPDSLQGPRLDDGDVDSEDENKPDLAAPGSNITAAELDTANGHSTHSGTSMAAPLVAGCAALILQANPGMLAKDVKDLLIRHADERGGPPFSPAFGNGIMNCFGAVDEVVNPVFPANLGFEFYLCRDHPTVPCWESPEISLANPEVVSGVPNTISVKVTNLGTTPATDFSVRTGIYDFSNSQSDLHLCTNFVAGPLAAGATVVVTCPWTPKTTGVGDVHACLKSEVVYPQDEDFGNNQAQHNVMIEHTHSPASFQLLVVNPTAQALTIHLAAELTAACPWDLDHDGSVGAGDQQILAARFGTSCAADWLVCPGDFDSNHHVSATDVAIFNAHAGQSCPADWSFTTSANNFVLAGDVCPLPITLQLNPGTSAAPSAIARVRVTGTPQAGPPIDLGGVTLIGVKSGQVPGVSGAVGWASLLAALLGSGTAALVVRGRRPARGPRPPQSN